jgi:hypothetical protein
MKMVKGVEQFCKVFGGGSENVEKKR